MVLVRLKGVVKARPSGSEEAIVIGICCRILRRFVFVVIGCEVTMLKVLLCDENEEEEEEEDSECVIFIEYNE
jgi:hypothetical protein